MSSNGRTADSGSVNGGSTPSIPAIRLSDGLARSSSGSGRRPLKAEITSSNLVRATMLSSGLLGPSGFGPHIWPVRLAVQDAALSRRRSPVRIWYGLPTVSGHPLGWPVFVFTDVVHGIPGLCPGHSADLIMSKCFILTGFAPDEAGLVWGRRWDVVGEPEAAPSRSHRLPPPRRGARPDGHARLRDGHRRRRRVGLGSPESAHRGERVRPNSIRRP